MASYFTYQNTGKKHSAIASSHMPSVFQQRSNGSIELIYPPTAQAQGGPDLALALKHDPVISEIESLATNHRFNEEQQQALTSLKESYTKLAETIGHASFNWYASVETLKAKAEHLTALASIATFLGLLQIGFMTFAANTELHSLRKAFDVLSYCALLVDAFCGIFSVLASGSISIATSPTKNYTTPRHATEVMLLLGGLKEQLKADHVDKDLVMSIDILLSSCSQEQKLAEKLAQSIKKFSKRDNIEYPLILLSTIFGAYLFIVSTFLYIGKTQPLGASVAIGSVAGLLTMAIILFAYFHISDHTNSQKTLDDLEQQFGHFQLNSGRAHRQTWKRATHDQSSSEVDQRNGNEAMLPQFSTAHSEI